MYFYQFFYKFCKILFGSRVSYFYNPLACLGLYCYKYIAGSFSLILIIIFFRFAWSGFYRLTNILKQLLTFFIYANYWLQWIVGLGWDLQDHMRESLVTASLSKALNTRKTTPGLVIHSDRGGQYAGNKFRLLLQNKDLVQSMSDADNPYDNAHMESFFSRLKAELIQGVRSRMLKIPEQKFSSTSMIPLR